MRDFEIYEIFSLAEQYDVTFLFDKKGLIISTGCVDNTEIIPTKRSYARRFEISLLENLDMELEDLVLLTLDGIKGV